MEHTISVLERQTLNLLTGGPSAGKTTLVYQAIAAHERGEPFAIPCLRFPPGQILVVNTDRPKAKNQKFFDLMGIRQTPFISLVEDRTLSALQSAKALRIAVSERIRALALPNLSTLILDLYDDFLDAKPFETRKLLQEGRINVQWAQDFNIAILGLTYPYKQKANNRAIRLQDRIAGAVHLQASAEWKFVITDKAETGTHWILDAFPGPFGGPPQTYHLDRQNDGNGVGPFIETIPPDPEANIEEIMERFGVDRRQAYRIKKRIEGTD